MEEVTIQHFIQAHPTACKSFNPTSFLWPCVVMNILWLVIEFVLAIVFSRDAICRSLHSPWYGLADYPFTCGKLAALCGLRRKKADGMSTSQNHPHVPKPTHCRVSPKAMGGNRRAVPIRSNVGTLFLVLRPPSHSMPLPFAGDNRCRKRLERLGGRGAGSFSGHMGLLFPSLVAPSDNRPGVKLSKESPGLIPFPNGSRDSLLHSA
jgi:hypothetical protein